MKLRLAAALLAALVAAPLAAVAQSPAGQSPAAQSPAAPPPATQGKGGGPLEACRADVDKLCAKAERAQGWRGKCLRDNAASLSDGCKAAVAAVRESREKVRAACASDISSLCKAEGEGKDARPMRCLKTNEAKLSAGCKTAMSAFTGGEPDGDAAGSAKQ